MSGRTDEVLDDIDATLDDYVEWEGSVDAASWSADGSHEVDTGGEYYGADRYPVADEQFWLTEEHLQLGGRTYNYVILAAGPTTT